MCSPHKRRTAEEIAFSKDRVPTISVDHCFMTASDETGSKNPFLVLYDNDSGSICAFATGTSNEAMDCQIREQHHPRIGIW